jgi:hypothetical protein
LEQKALNIGRKIMLILVILYGFYFMRSWIMGYQIALPWQIETTYQTKPLLLEYFEIDGEAAGIKIDQVLAQERFYTSDIVYSYLDHELFFWTFVLALVLLTALISYFDRTTYLIAAGAICLMLTQLKVDALGVLEEYLVMVIIGIFLVCSYYFQAFKPSASLGLRLLVTTLLYSILITAIGLVSPMMHVSIVALGNGLMGPLILCLLFLLFIAGENIFTLFKLTTTAQPGKRGLWHFLFFGGIYVTLCFLLFLEKESGLGIQLDYLDPRFLVLFSLVSAYLSFDQRHAKYSPAQRNILKYLLYPAGVCLLLITYSFAVNSANDSLQSALDWGIIATHMGMGAAYFVYAMINFVPELWQGLPVWKIFYMGQRTAILTLRLMGFVLCVGAYFYLENIPYYEAEAAQFNIQGDLAQQLGTKQIANSYYDQAIYNDLYSFKANYSLFRMAEKDFDKAESRDRIARLFRQRDNALARVILANAYSDEKRLYRGLEVLQEATTSKEDPHLMHNLGVAHYRYSNYDSAYKYFDAAAMVPSEANLAATKFNMHGRIVLEPETLSDDMTTRLNQQALANINGWDSDFNYEPLADSILNKDHLYYLYNAASSQRLEDYEGLIAAIDYYLANDNNGIYEDFLLTAKALAYYHIGEVNKAFNTLDLTINRNPESAGFESFLKAVWYFDQGQGKKSVEYVQLAQRRAYTEDQVNDFIDVLQNIRNYDEKADISADLTDALSILNEESKQAALIAVASKNAFDVKSTLEAVEALLATEIDRKVIYDLLLAATKLNDESPELLEAYIYQAESLNYSNFANSALERYSFMVPYEEYFRVAKALNELKEAKRQAPLN